MTLQAKTKFAFLMSRARAALWDAGTRRGKGDSRAMLHAASAASRAAGFIEAVNISDPVTAQGMVDEFETLVDDAHQAMEGGRS